MKSSSEQRQVFRTIAGLPFSTAIIYAPLFVAAFLFYSFLWVEAPLMSADSGGYIQAAHDLSDFRMDQLQERGPGYPVFILLTSWTQAPNRTLFLVSLALHFFSIWLLAIVLWRAGLTQTLLLLFGLILLLPPFVEPAAYVLSETLTQAMLVGAVISFVFWSVTNRARWILLSGLFIGCAALTRPTYQILSLVIVGYVLVMHFVLVQIATNWRELITASLALMVATVFTVGSYSVLNYKTFGYLGITPKLGLTLSQKTLRVIERLPDEYAVVRETLIRARNAQLINGASHTGSDYIWAALPQLTEITGLSYVRLSGYMLQINWLLIQKAPLYYVQEAIWAFGSYWLPSSGDLANFNSRSMQSVWVVIHFCLMAAFFYNLVLVTGAVIYIRNCKWMLNRADGEFGRELTWIKSQGLIYGFAGIIVFYTAGISSLTETGVARYRVPTDSLIVFMIFLGILLWWHLVDLSRPVFAQSTTPAT